MHSDMAGAVEDVGMVRILTMQEIDGKGMYPVREWPNLDQTLGRPNKIRSRMMILDPKHHLKYWPFNIRLPALVE